LPLLLAELSRGQNLSAALTAAIGADTPEFEREFHTYLGTRFNIATLFMDTMLFWVGLAVVVVIGTFIRLRKRRRYYKQWEEEEKLHSTDFDYGDPDHPEQTDADDDEPWQN
jgi:hypothetical protein